MKKNLKLKKYLGFATLSVVSAATAATAVNAVLVNFSLN